MHARVMVTTTCVVVAILGLTMLDSGFADPPPTLRYISFSTTTPPGNSLAFRQALAYALDREMIAKAVAPFVGGPVAPAPVIQHPRLAGYNPALHGYTFDPAKAKDLFKQSGWSASLTVLAAPANTKLLTAFEEAVVASLRATLGITVTYQRVANFKALVDAMRSGAAPIFLGGWTSDRSDYAYPSFALGLAYDLRIADSEIKPLVEKKDAAAVEPLLLDKALIVPIITY